MPDGRLPYSLEEVGPLAARCLASPAAGRVAAVFQRSFYLELAGDWLCLGTRNLGLGPLNARTSAPAAADWRAAGLRPGQAVTLRDGWLRLDGGLVFSAHAARVWHPPAASWSAASLAAGLDVFAAQATRHAPEEGFGFLFRQAPCTSPLARAAEGAISSLTEWLEPMLAGRAPLTDPPHDEVCRLLGLGPGLTPSGDDFLAGTLVALAALGARDPQARLADAVLGAADRLTTPISAAHLRAAAEGLGSAALHLMIAAVLSGKRAAITAALPALNGTGHSSGWDGAAGALAVLGAAYFPATATG